MNYLEFGGYTAEFVSYRQTIEGDIVTSIYRTSGDGTIVVLYDNTRDRFGSGEWITHTCTGASLGEEPWYEINLEGCGQDVVLE